MAVGEQHNLLFRVEIEDITREKNATEQAFAVTGRHEYHQPLDLAVSEVLQVFYDDIVMPVEFKMREDIGDVIYELESLLGW